MWVFTGGRLATLQTWEAVRAAEAEQAEKKETELKKNNKIEKEEEEAPAAAASAASAASVASVVDKVPEDKASVAKAVFQVPPEPEWLELLKMLCPGFLDGVYMVAYEKSNKNAERAAGWMMDQVCVMQRPAGRMSHHVCAACCELRVAVGGVHEPAR